MVLTSQEYKRLAKIKTQEPIQYPEGYFQPWNKKKGGEREDLIFAVWRKLRLLYSDHLRDVEGMGRLFDIPGDPNNYSKLNFLSSNSKTFAIMVNYFNRKIVEMAQKDELIHPRQLLFDKDKINWKSEMYFFLKLFDKYYKEILIPNDNGVFDELIRVLDVMGKRGHDSEEQMMKFLKNVFPPATNWKVGSDGKSDDIIKGIDIQFDLKGQTHTIQQKSCSYISHWKGYYYVNGVGGIGIYDTTYYGFRTQKDELYLFKNDKSIEIVDYKDKLQYKIPERLKEYDTKI